MSKSFVYEVTTRLNAGPILSVDVWRKFADDLVENLDSGMLSVNDALSVGLEDGKVVVNVYYGDSEDDSEDNSYGFFMSRFETVI